MGSKPPFVPALIVIDMQEDFCEPNGCVPLPNARSVVQPVNRLLSLPFAVRIGTRDYHPPDHVSMAYNHPEPNNKPLTRTTHPNPDDPTDVRPLILAPPHCIQGTPGAELISELDSSKLDVVINKAIDPRAEMYSIFTDVFGRKVGSGAKVADVDLEAYLRERGVTDLFVCGMNADCCVKATALDAMKMGFGAVVVGDAVRSAEGLVEGWTWEKTKGELEGERVPILGVEEVNGQLSKMGVVVEATA